MKRRRTLTTLSLTVTIAAPLAAAPLWEAPEPDAALTTAVVRRNIFLADRAALEAAARRAEAPPAVPRTPPEAPPPPPPADPDASRVLVGVVVVDGAPTAFVEDREAKRIDRVTGPGDFGAGRITAITLTGVTYVVGDDEPRTIGLRQSFTGEDAAPTAPPAATPTATGGGAAAPSDAGLSLLERMRQRRARESAPPPPDPGPDSAPGPPDPDPPSVPSEEPAS